MGHGAARQQVRFLTWFTDEDPFILRPMIRGLLDRAKKLAEDNLPSEVVDAGRKVRDEVLKRAGIASGPDEEAEDGGAAAHEGADEPRFRENPHDVLQRVKTKADRGLKPEDSLVVVYATGEQADEVEQIMQSLKGVDTTIRQIDLDRERPQVRTQLAKLTGKMVPPYVYINGRYWGSTYDIESLRVCGDLPHVVANRLDEIGEEAKRIGDIRESFSDEISVDNILKRWKLGHILCVDDLDAWYEVEKGEERFYYQGGPRAVDDMRAVAEEITAAVADDEYEAHWQLEPSVHVE